MKDLCRTYVVLVSVFLLTMGSEAGAAAFIPLGALHTGRVFQTATLLPNGKVLVAGGATGGTPVNSVEIYDPATGVWTVTNSMGTARADDVVAKWQGAGHSGRKFVF